MLLSKLFLVALLVVPSLSLIAPLPTKLLHVAATTTTPTTSTTRLTAAIVGGTKTGENGDSDHAGADAVSAIEKEKPLPREMMPITMGVFAQMLGEGIALSSLPLYLTRPGATPTTVGLAISCFSLAQMTFAPILVGLSSRIGRSIVLRI